MPDLSQGPSPYVSLYIARNQAEAIRKILRGEKARNRDVARALRRIEEALGVES